MENLEIIIKGAIGNFNFGDDLLTYSICEYLNQIDIPKNVTIISESNYLYRYIDNIKIIRNYDVSGIYDVMLYAGGTQFASFDKKLSKEKLLKRILNILLNKNNVYKKIKTKIFGYPLFQYKYLLIVGIGIGPFRAKDRYFHSIIKLLSKSDFLYVRDELSSRICKENQLNFSIGSDLVFSLPDSWWNKTNHRNNKIERIGIIIRDWNFCKEKGSFIYRLQDINLKKYCIEFYSFCKVKDKVSIEYLKSNGFSDSINIWDPYEMTFSEYIKNISLCDILLTARYHGAIIASLLGIPFISIGIEPKLRLVAELFEMPCWEYPYEAEDCLAKIHNLEFSYSSATQKISTIVAKEKNKNKIMMNNLNKFLIVLKK